jgi:hypothetical protein
MLPPIFVYPHTSIFYPGNIKNLLKAKKKRGETPLFWIDFW